MKRILILLTFFCLLFPCFISASELVKPGVYDFNEVVNQMGDQPYMRKMFPEMLGTSLFMLKMLAQQNKDFFSSLKTLSNDDKIEYYAKKNALKMNMNTWLTSSMGYRKSSSVKKVLITGITLSRNYKGYNIILKPGGDILYWNTGINKDIAKSIAFYLEKKAKGGTMIEEEVDQTPNIPSTSGNN